MHVAAIELEDFRSYRDRRLDLAPGVTAFVGPNGAGKTNILEAVHVIARGESSRAGDDVEMIRWGTPLARVAIDASRAQDRTRLEVTLFAPAADVRRRPRRSTADGAPGGPCAAGGPWASFARHAAPRPRRSERPPRPTSRMRARSKA